MFVTFYLVPQKPSFFDCSCEGVTGFSRNFGRPCLLNSTKPQRRPLFSSRFVLHESGSRELAQSWQVKFSQRHCQYIDIPPGRTFAQSFIGGLVTW